MRRSNLVPIVFALFSWSAAHAGSDPNAPAPDSGEVVKVYDGDTITLSGGDKVRLKWVNTPELRPLEPFAKEARDAAAELVMGQTVHLAYGPGGKRDGYGRLVAGVRTEEADLSSMLVEKGLAHVFIIPPDDLDPSALLALQEEAKAAKRGIWSLDQFQGPLHITSFHANGRGDDRAFPNGEYLRVTNITSAPIDLSAFTIENFAGTRFDLPDVSLPPGHTVKIHSGKGTHKTDPAAQIAIYLGSDGPLYDNKRDRVTIRTKDGAVVTERQHQVK
jgi:endonuclease YncB( thermonuclease family)